MGAHWPEDILAGAPLGLMIAYFGSLLSLKPFSMRGSYIAAAFLALAALVGNLTSPADFPEITSIAWVRMVCAVLAVAAIIYYAAKLFMLHKEQALKE